MTPAPTDSRRKGLVRLAFVALLLSGCATKKSLMQLKGGESDALVTVNDHYIGKLGRLQHGIRLEPGEYRVTVEKLGYFPFDQLVEVGEQPAQVEVELVPIPD